ncbi:MAG TPA: hypothetical protein VHO43_11615 [Ignavibacteriales bacterium]|nr:hypothetical protein [Ignavibacteriales bacterium]
MERKHFFTAAVLILTFAVSGCTEITPPEFNNASDPLLASYPVPVPSALMASLRSSTEVVLEWGSKWTYEKGCIVERSINGGSFEKIADLPAFSTEYVDSGLDTTKNYSYRVKRFSDISESKYSRVAMLQAPLKGALRMKPISSSTYNAGVFSHNQNLLATYYNNKSGQIVFWKAPQYTVDNFISYTGKPIKTMSFSPNDKLLACGSPDDYTVYIYDMNSKTLHNSIKGITGGISSIDFSPDGKFLAVALLSMDILIYNTDSWTVSYTLKGHYNPVNVLRFSPDGSLLASGSADGNIIFWNTSSWTAVRTIAVGERNVICLAFRPDGQVLAAAAGMNYYQFETSTGNKLRSISSGSNAAITVTFSNDGKRFAGTCGTGVSIFDSNYQLIPLDFGGASTSTYSFKSVLAAPGDGLFITLGYPIILWAPGNWTISYL